MATIETRSASKRTPVLSEQIQLFAMLGRDLIEAYARRQRMGLDEFYELPEYRRFELGAYACGFVCRDLAHMNGPLFDLMNTRPRECIPGCSFNVLRRWFHTLLRAERWSHGYGSLIRDAIDSGALAIAFERLNSGADPMQHEAVDERAA